MECNQKIQAKAEPVAPFLACILKRRELAKLKAKINP